MPVPYWGYNAVPFFLRRNNTIYTDDTIWTTSDIKGTCLYSGFSLPRWPARVTMRSCHGTWPSFIKNVASFSRTSIATLQSRCTQYKSEQNYWHLLWTVICKLEHEFYKNNGSTFLKLRCKKECDCDSKMPFSKNLILRKWIAHNNAKRIKDKG